MNQDLVKGLYEPHVLRARERLKTDPGILSLLDPALDPVLLERFLIAYHAFGVRMTEPVEGWIRGAGERCAEVGLEEIGRTLCAHARHEAGHHLMMIEDTRQLVRRWNERNAHKLDAEALFAAPMLRSTAEYIKLHEDTIAGPMPFGQVAIEFEIEGISVSLFTGLVAHWRRVLGPEGMAGISFLQEHVELDVGHTQLNEKMMSRLLAARPAAAEPLGHIGSRAIDIYIAFMNECLSTARGAQRTATPPAKWTRSRHPSYPAI